jgi:hypothetical protein
MQNRKQFLFTLTSAVVLAACAKDQVDAPALPTSVARSVAAVAASCDFSTMNQHARDYIRRPDALYDRLTVFEAAYNAGGAAGATNAGFDVLQYISTALGVSGKITGTPAAGNALVNDVLACMSVGTLPAGFTVEGSLSANGLFAVVGGLGDATGAVTSRGTPLYGAEPQAGQTWYGSAGNQRYLVYGYERDFAFTPETPAAATAFELATVPAGVTFNPAIAGGICQTTATNSQLQSVNAILAPVTLGFCSGVTQSEYQGTGLFAMARRAAASLFAPSPLFAGVGGTGGLLSGLSPKAAVTFAPAAAGLTFVQQPVDTKRSLGTAQFSSPISVRVTTAAGTTIGGVLVTLTPVNNKGSWDSFNNTAVTGANGIAVFQGFWIDKSGGYNLVASGVVFGQPTKSASSNRFNVAGQ